MSFNIDNLNRNNTRVISLKLQLSFCANAFSVNIETHHIGKHIVFSLFAISFKFSLVFPDVNITKNT